MSPSLLSLLSVATFSFTAARADAAVHPYNTSKDPTSAAASQRPTCTCIEKPTCPPGKAPAEAGNCGGHGQYPYYCCAAAPQPPPSIPPQAAEFRRWNNGACASTNYTVLSTDQLDECAVYRVPA